MSAQQVDAALIAPVVALAVAAVVVLLADLVAPGRRNLCAGLAVAGLVVTGALIPSAARDLPAARGTFCAPGSSAVAGCSLVVDRFSVVLWSVALFGALIVALLSWSASLASPQPAAVGEYYALLLASTAGVLSLAASRDLLTLLVSLELVTLPVVVLVAVRGWATSAEGAVKLFLVSTLGLGISVFGAAVVLGATGHVHLARISRAVAQPDWPTGRLSALTVGLVLLLVAFGIKVALVPLHIWAPETYTGAPIPIAGYLAVVSKLAGVAGILLVLVVGFAPLASRWAPLLAVVAAVTMTVANLVALRQREAIGLLAWSSIAQAGWVVAPLAAAGWDSEAARRASVVYLVCYAAMTLATFTAVTLVGRARTTVGGGLALSDFHGLARTEPLTAGLLVFALACLAGLPPGLVGLFAKLAAFSPVVGGGQVWLAVIMALNVALALAYYLRWAAMVFARPEGGVEPISFRLSIPDGVAVGLTLTAIVVLSAAPTLVFHLVG